MITGTLMLKKYSQKSRIKQEIKSWPTNWVILENPVPENNNDDSTHKGDE